MGKSILFALLFLLPVPVFAATIQVPQDHATIQAAISAAAQGDTILVSPGTYVENIDYLGKAITVKSSDGPELTSISGSYLDSVVVFKNQETRDAVLDGFTIEKGASQTGGGGITCLASSPTLINNRIRFNDGWYEGGGLYTENGAPLVQGNLIEDNVAWSGSGIFGYGSAAEILDNRIISNGMGGCDIFGAGIYFKNSSIRVEGNLISDNLSEEGGAGIWMEGGDLELYGNTISHNQSIWIPSGVYCTGDLEAVDNHIFGNNYGGLSVSQGSHLISGNRIHDNGWAGILCYKDGGQIVNNMIYGNDGHGITCHSVTSTTAITNNTIVDNQLSGLHCEASASPVVTNTILFGNLARQIDISSGAPVVTYCNVQGSWPGAGNINADPLFAAPNNHDYHILYTSPCRNGGDGAAPGLPAMDFEGDPRVAQGAVDMGADEFHTHLYCTGDAVPSGTLEVNFIALPGSMINGLLLGVNIFDPPLVCDYGLWYMDNPFQVFTGLGILPAEGIITLAGILPASPPGPYTFYLQAAIAYELTNLCTVQVE